MFLHPDLLLEVARQRHRDLLDEVERHRLARRIGRASALDSAAAHEQRTTVVARRARMRLEAEEC